MSVTVQGLSRDMPETEEEENVKTDDTHGRGKKKTVFTVNTIFSVNTHSETHCTVAN